MTRTTSEETAVEANRLYWETDTSVAGIAEQLQLSRRALYDVVQPLPSGGTCETCGSPLVFENRSARTAGTQTCIVCEDGDEDEEPEPVAPAALPRELAVEPLDGERAVRVGGAVLAGAALGALVTLVLVPRR